MLNTGSKPFKTDSFEQSHPLSRLVQSLAEVVTSSEDDFISLGMNLQQVQLMSSSQRKKITAAMDRFNQDGDGGMLQQISRYVKNCQQTAQAAQQSAGGLCGNLSAMLQRMNSIARKSHSLERAGMLLRVIGINTGVECARYTTMERMFKMVSTDTIHLSEQIRVATDQLLDQIAGARANQSNILTEARQSIEVLEELVQVSKQATETALEKVEELINYSITMVNEAEQIAANISLEINKVVVGIQFHDNLRQRIEHVNAALLETAELTDGSSAEEFGNTYLIIELQKAQLDHLIDELDCLHATQSQALRNIIGEVSLLSDRLKGMVSEQPTLSDGQSPVQMLINGIATLEEISGDSRTLGQKIRAAAKHAEQIVDDMQTAVKNTYSIATHVKINALNAIIKAAKFGHSGKAMQVLAQSMVTVSKDTHELVTIFEELLTELHSLAQGEEKNSADTPEVAFEDFDSSRMQQLFQDFRNELQTSRQDCQTLSTSLEKEHQQLLFIAGLKEALLQFSELLGNYAASIAPENDELLACLRKKFGDQMHSRYTMDKERDIHNQIKAVAPAAAHSAGSKDVLFFDDFSASETNSATASVTDNIDLWDDVPSGSDTNAGLWGNACSQPTATAGTVELRGGDNIQPNVTDNHVKPLDKSTDTESSESADTELWNDTSPVPPGQATEEERQRQQKEQDQNQKKHQPKEDFGDNVELF